MKREETLITRDSIKNALECHRDFVIRYIGRALVALYNRQTREEQACDTVRNNNTVGFSGYDAVAGCKTAKFFLKHNTLLDWQIAAWSRIGKNGYPRLAKYHRQLNQIAIEKKQRQFNAAIVNVETLTQEQS